MTADDYAAAWLAEMWKPVPEWHPSVAAKLAAEERNAQVRAPGTVSAVWQNTGEAAERGNAPRPLDPPSVLDYRKGDPW